MKNINFKEVFNLMQESFPEVEYRTYENQKKLLKNPNYELLEFRDDFGKLMAFMAVWNLPTFKFIEHLAVSKECRGMGIGSKIMREFIEKSNSKIILEIEIPKDEITTKRLRFYEKLGFNMNEFEYTQLPLREKAPIIPMAILSYPEKLSREEFLNIRNILHSGVYSEN